MSLDAWSGRVSLPPGNGSTSSCSLVLIETVEDYAIFALDADGHVATWNRGAELLKGYRADEIIGRHVVDASTPTPTWSPGSPSATSRSRWPTGNLQEEGWRVRKDGTPVLGERRRSPRSAATTGG